MQISSHSFWFLQIMQFLLSQVLSSVCGIMQVNEAVVSGWLFFRYLVIGGKFTCAFTLQKKKKKPCTSRSFILLSCKSHFPLDCYACLIAQFLTLVYPIELCKDSFELINFIHHLVIHTVSLEH